MSVYSAQALTPVSGYRGLCGLEVTNSSITITAKEEDCRILGTWSLDCIRRFTSRPVGIFSFISGRRGPFGVQECEFKLLEKELFELNSIINRLTGTDLETLQPEPTKSPPPPGYTVFQRAMSVDQMPSTPPAAGNDDDLYEILSPSSERPRIFSRRISDPLHETPHSTTEEHYEVMIKTKHARTPAIPVPNYEVPRPTYDASKEIYDIPRPTRDTSREIYDVPRPTSLTNGDNSHGIYDVPNRRYSRRSSSSSHGSSPVKQYSPSQAMTPGSDYINVSPEDSSVIQAQTISSPQTREHSYYENIKPAKLSCVCENGSSSPGDHRRTVISGADYSNVLLRHTGYECVDSVVPNNHCPHYEQADPAVGKPHHHYEWCDGDFKNT